MQAFRLEGAGATARLFVVNEAARPPRHDEVLLRVHASSLNFRDLALKNGLYPMPRRDGLIQLSDAAAEVVEVGSETTRFKVGDRVCSMFFPGWYGGAFPQASIAHQYGSNLDGWLCEYKTVRAEDLVLAPTHLDYREAATLPCAALTAWTALHGARAVGPGEVVLIQGSGGVALLALQLARLMGARVIAITSDDAKAERLRQLGASDVINYRRTPEWAAEVRRLTNGVGVDRIVEVGGPGTLAQSLAAIAIGGEIALIGFVAAGAPSVDFMTLFMSGAILRRIGVGSRDDFEQMNRAISQHGLRPVLDRDFALADCVDAYDYLASGQHVGKVTLSH